MTSEQVRIRELVAWGLDEDKYRPESDEIVEKAAKSQIALTQRNDVVFQNPIVNCVNAAVTEALDQQQARADLHAEMQGLDWEIGVVDLKQLIAFQRRLIFDDRFLQSDVPSPDDWSALIRLSFGPPASVSYRAVTSDGSQMLLQSENPNLQFRTSAGHSDLPIRLHGGSPFFEVAEFNGRWFLRDGYHRAYRLLSRDVAHVPAVIVRARNLAELGPVHPWFFDEETLFTAHPPRVTDFLDDSLTIEYNRPRLFKTLRLKIEESVEPGLFMSNSGE